MSNEFKHTVTTIVFPIEHKNRKKRRMIRGYGGKKMDHNENHPMWDNNVEDAVRTAAEAVTGVASFLNEEPIQKIVKDIKEEQNTDKENIRKVARNKCLEEAAKIISGNRQDDYGTPEDSFSRIADYWNDYLIHKNITDNSHSLYPVDVAAMMILFKIAREEHSHKHDNLVDICGYTAILDDMYKD